MKRKMEDLEGGIILEEYPQYIVYDNGEIYSSRSKKYMKKMERGGYYFVSIYNSEGKRKQFGVHRLVALAFLENSKNLPVVNHKNGNGLDNCVNNLEWCTHRDNCVHAVKMGLVTKSNKKILQFDLNGDFVGEYDSITEAAKINKLRTDSISRVLRGIRETYAGFSWKYKNVNPPHKTIHGEIWCPLEINGYGESSYEISTCGRIWSHISQKIKKQTKRKDGYMRIVFGKTKYYVHRLVATVFLEYPFDLKRPVVNHIDGNKSNNNIENLEWVELEQNVQHAHDSGFYNRPKIIQYNREGKKIKTHKNSKDAALSVGGQINTITNACRTHSCAYDYFWIYVGDNVDISELKAHKRRVVQYDLKGNKLATFDSIKEAATELKIDRSVMSRVLSGKGRTAGGFQWKYKGEDPPNKIKKCVGQYSLDGKLIKKWNTIVEIERELGINGSHISSVCKGKRKTTGGFIWKYI